MIKDLSLDPETKTLESSLSFLENPEAIQVTHPECPSKDPTYYNSGSTWLSYSAILFNFFFFFAIFSCYY